MDDRAQTKPARNSLVGTSFSRADHQRAVALLAPACPHLIGAEIVDILFASADDLGALGTDAIFGRGRLNIASAFQPIGTTSMAGSQTAVSTTSNGDLPPAAGDGGGHPSTPLGAVILDGYSRAFVVDLARTLRAAVQSKPLARALQGEFVSLVLRGPITSHDRNERHDLPQDSLERLGIGPG